MAHDQAYALRHLVIEAACGADRSSDVPLVAVHGGKGGVGTTTIATNLSVALARLGRRVVLVDADLDHGGNAESAQGQQRGTIIDVLHGRRAIADVLESGPAGVLVLGGEWASNQVTTISNTAYDRFCREIKAIGAYADVVVVDAGSGRGRFARRLWNAAEQVLIVSTPDASAIMEAYAAIKVLAEEAAQASIYTLVNHAAEAAAARDVHARIATASEKFLGRRIAAAGYLGTSAGAEVPDGARIFAARSGEARAVERVAGALWPLLQTERPHNKGGEPIGGVTHETASDLPTRTEPPSFPDKEIQRF